MAGATHRKGPISWLLRLIQGAFIGGGAILPGISGGVLAVAFGIYRPMMAMLAHPKREWRRHFPLLLPVLIGWAAGFIFFARLVETMFLANEVITVWLFIGLIGGTLPSLFRTARAQGSSKWDWPMATLAFALFTAFMLWARVGFSASITPNAGWFLLCGVAWGLSVVVPGMTSSSLLMSLGLYLPMTSGIAGLDFGVLLPMAVGILAVVLTLPRLINYLFDTRYSLAYHFVIGLTLASTVVILPTAYSGAREIILSVAAAAFGFLLAWAMEKYVHE